MNIDNINFGDDPFDDETTLSKADIKKIEIIKSLLERITQALDNIKFSEPKEYLNNIMISSEVIDDLRNIENIIINPPVGVTAEDIEKMLDDVSEFVTKKDSLEIKKIYRKEKEAFDDNPKEENKSKLSSINLDDADGLDDESF